jgi:Lrp/AsnC family leucine-responsive transcriptional regulator
MQEKDKTDYDSVMSTYYGDDQVTALINLKVDTKDADTIAEKVAGFLMVEDVFLVTGDTDIVAKVKFHNYNQLKGFLVDDLSSIAGVKETRTLMVVTTFKERGELKFDTGEEKEGAEASAGQR